VRRALVGRRAAQRVHRHVERTVELPGVGGLDLVLQVGLSREELPRWSVIARRAYMAVPLVMLVAKKLQLPMLLPVAVPTAAKLTLTLTMPLLKLVAVNLSMIVVVLAGATYCVVCAFSMFLAGMMFVAIIGMGRSYQVTLPVT
jgi:hypothetical protein